MPQHVGEPLRRNDKNLIDAAMSLRHGLTDTSRLDLIYARRSSPIVS